MAPTVTHWYRLEPRPRSNSIQRSLEAQVRDPLWMLARQWQIGEFHGEDAASPAFVELSVRTSRIRDWRPSGKAGWVSHGAAPIEAQLLHEPFSPRDDSLRVELGQLFESLLKENLNEERAESHIASFRRRFPIDPSSVSDPDRIRFLKPFVGRVTDGLELLDARDAILVDTTVQEATPALRDFFTWVDQVFGSIGSDDPTTWTPERLEYQADVRADSPSGAPLPVTFSVHPDRDGTLEWRAFESRAEPSGAPATATSMSERSMNILPSNVTFRGMPSPRWWEFEDGRTNLSDLKPDKRDLAKLVLMDFMLVHSSDWYVLPWDQDVGSLASIVTFRVHDVFDGVTDVARADARPPQRSTKRWTMFSTSKAGDANALEPFFLLPPTASNAIQMSEPIEEVRFIRDEGANMVWAIEHTTENRLGNPFHGHERTTSGTEDGEPPAPADDATGETPALQYVLQTMVPDHWIPFLPVKRVGSTSEIELERAAMNPQLPGAGPPYGKILRPRVSPYHIREEEVPRTGVHVQRRIFLSRWIDGSCHIWMARSKRSGMGEGSSGLRFDLALRSGDS